MYNLLRASVAFCLLATVASAAVIQQYSVESSIDFTGTGVTATISAAGANGQLKGKGQLKLFKTAIYPLTVTTGTIGVDTVTLEGTIKRQGLRHPFVLVITQSTGEATMDISDPTNTTVLNTLDGIAKTKVR